MAYPIFRVSLRRRFRRQLIATTASAALLAGAFSLASAQQQQAVGEANQIKNQVTGSIRARRLVVSDPVYRTERISAAADSYGELLLLDDAKVLVGPGSEVELDQFVVANNDITSGTFKVTKGAFRFIGSGKDDSKVYTVKTPLSSIGVRGTVFDVYVGDGGMTRVVLLGGSVSVCSSGVCKIASRRCDIIEVPAPRQVDQVPFFKSASRSAGDSRNLFNLLFAQQRFSSGWRAPTVACNQRASIEARDGPETDSERGGLSGAGSAPSGDDGYNY